MFIKTDGEEAINSLFVQSLRIVKVCDDPDVYALEAKLVSGATELIEWLEQSLGIVIPEYEPSKKKGRNRHALGKLV